jgi:ABC-2 type transport system ATP-binding protein
MDMNANHAMVEAKDLTKFYGSIKAIEKLNFTLNRGEILGFLGPNGAGKTTTMKILTCFISPTSGTARVNGHDVFDDAIEARRGTGYLPENAPLYREMTVLEDLEFFAEMRDVAKDRRAKAIRRVVDVCGLGDVVGREIRELSKGFRQRVGLAQAMVHDPDIIILDEPTSGLDPNQIVEIRSLIKELGKERTIILSTHNLAEVQAACSRVIIINKGRIVADGTVAELSAQRGGRRHTVVTRSSDLAALRSAVEKVAKVVRSEASDPTEDGEVSLAVFGEGDADLRADLAKAIVAAGVPLLGLTRSTVSLEDVFRGVTRGRGRPSADAARAAEEDEGSAEPEDVETEPEDDTAEDDESTENEEA